MPQVGQLPQQLARHLRAHLTGFGAEILDKEAISRTIEYCELFPGCGAAQRAKQGNSKDE